MVNKVFEIIEAKIFNLEIEKIKSFTSRPMFTLLLNLNGLTKLLTHDTDMKIPIFNFCMVVHLQNHILVNLILKIAISI